MNVEGITIKVVDFVKERVEPLRAGANYVCRYDEKMGYGIIVVEDTLKMAIGAPLGTYENGNLILIGGDGLIDLKDEKTGVKMDLNATTVYLKVSDLDKGLLNVTAYKIS